MRRRDTITMCCNPARVHVFLSNKITVWQSNIAGWKIHENPPFIDDVPARNLHLVRGFPNGNPTTHDVPTSWIGS